MKRSGLKIKTYGERAGVASIETAQDAFKRSQKNTSTGVAAGGLANDDDRELSGRVQKSTGGQGLETEAPRRLDVFREALWTVKDVAAYLRVSRSWVYSQSAAGVLPCIYLGGLLRFEPSAIKSWVQSVARPAATDGAFSLSAASSR